MARASKIRIWFKVKQEKQYRQSGEHSHHIIVRVGVKYNTKGTEVFQLEPFRFQLRKGKRHARLATSLTEE